MSKSRIVQTIWLLAILTALLPMKTNAQKTIYNSPYVSFSPDGKAWTTNSGDRNTVWYEYGRTVYTGIPSTARTPGEGEHTYINTDNAMVPIGYWKVAFPGGHCIHGGGLPSDYQYHDLDFRVVSCMNSFYSGWLGYCADCGEAVLYGLVYMSETTARSIHYVPADSEYYYLCPHCRNLEQGYSYTHRCTKVSKNRYRVIYRANALGVSGTMQESIHVYDNEAFYEGHDIHASVSLRRNSFVREGYEFLGWNTAPDGSGTSFSDGEAVVNLTTENWENGTDKGTVVLYAQWKARGSVLCIDPAGGVYCGSGEVTQIEKAFGEDYTLALDSYLPPAGFWVSFDTHGGDAIAPVRTLRRLRGWVKQEPFLGYLNGNVYYFSAPAGTTDRLIADCEEVPIILPEAHKEGYLFTGWFWDSGYTQPVGMPGDAVVITRDTELHAGWAEPIPALTLDVTIERILPPHDPIFKGGESGVLTMKAGGGATRLTVEYPQQMFRPDSSLQRQYEYPGNTEPLVIQEDFFLIPLYMPAAVHLPVKVTAYRGEESVEREVYLSVIASDAGVLSELRTRLR